MHVMTQSQGPQLSAITTEIHSFLDKYPWRMVELTGAICWVLARYVDPTLTTISRPKWSTEMRKPRGEGRRSPIQFIKEEYREELDARVLTRIILKNSDEPLYRAYASWIHRHPGDDLQLPKQVRACLEDMLPQQLLAHKRAQNRAGQKSLCRRKREEKLAIFRQRP